MDSSLDRWIARNLATGALAPLGDRDVRALVDQVGEHRVAGGTFVFRQGDVLDHVHVLRSGAVELRQRAGDHRVAIQLVRPGEVFGDVPLLLGQPAPFDAQAIKDSRILSIEVRHLFTLLGERPRLARRWMVSLAERTSRLHQRVGVLLAGGLEARVAMLLLHRAVAGEVHLSQALIAELLGSGRTSVNRVLKDLERGGLVELGYGRVVLVDETGLHALVDS